MKKIILVSVSLALLLTVLVCCSDYVAPVEPSDTGESITPEQMVEISKEMQQTTAAPIESSPIESALSEPMQSEAATVVPSEVESSVMEPVQTTLPSVATTIIESSTITTVHTEILPVETSTPGSSFVNTVPADTTTAAYEPIETTVANTSTSDVGNETPIVPMVNGQAYVYWTPGGSVWHTTSGCSSLSRSKEIVGGSVAEAQAAGKDRACMRCD